MATAANDLEAIIARTALKYDQLPYESKPFSQSQPSRLAAMARIFGLEATPMDGARVLELGCASGGNIIPHAVRHPGARFVGVDLGRTQVAAGRTRIERLGLNNIEIHCQSFTEIGEELGTFDYIICHGVYSWVPPQVQDAILRVIRTRLSPVGVASVSYNVLPGWRLMQPIRDALLTALPETADLKARTAKAREVLAFMAANTTDNGPYGESLRNWNDRLATLPDDYLCHEFLEDCNEPTTICRFASAANRHGLGYLGDCEFAAMIPDNYGAELAAKVRAAAGNDLVASEQWLDILSGRTFRQSVLVAEERMNGVNRALSPGCLSGLHVLLPERAEVTADESETRLSLSNDRNINTRSPAVGELLVRLGALQPASLAVDDTLAAADPEDRADLADALYSMVISGIASAQTEPAGCIPQAGTAPCASELSRSDAAADLPGTTNLRHEYVSFDPAAQALLPHLAGELSRDELVEQLVEAAIAGKLSFAREGVPLTAAADIRAAAAEHLPELLAGIARAGLLEG